MEKNNFRIDSEYIYTFIMTYRSFTTGSILVAALLQRYKHTKDTGMDPEAALRIRARILDFFKQWILDIRGCYDLIEDNNLLTTIQNFLKNTTKDVKIQAQEVNELLEKRVFFFSVFEKKKIPKPSEREKCGI